MKLEILTNNQGWRNWADLPAFIATAASFAAFFAASIAAAMMSCSTLGFRLVSKTGEATTVAQTACPRSPLSESQRDFRFRVSGSGLRDTFSSTLNEPAVEASGPFLEEADWEGWVTLETNGVDEDWGGGGGGCCTGGSWISERLYSTLQASWFSLRTEEQIKISGVSQLKMLISYHRNCYKLYQSHARTCQLIKHKMIKNCTATAEKKHCITESQTNAA